MKFRIDYKLFDFSDNLIKIGNKIIVAGNKTEAKLKVKDSLSKDFRFKKMLAKATILDDDNMLAFLQDLFGFNNLN